MTEITKNYFGTTRDGQTVDQYRMRNGRGMQVDILTYGCIIRSILIPMGEGQRDVVLGYDDLESYEKGTCFFGCFVGRYANRIGNAEFVLNGKTFSLPKNDGENHLHGTYCERVFEAEVQGETLVLRASSPDGEEGYPGRMEIEVRYLLTPDNSLCLEYRAVTDQDTVVNLTNHSYFNLDGAGGGDVLEHTVRILSDRFTECDRGSIPTGIILTVEKTALDFREPKKIGRDLFAEEPQIRSCGGFDNNYIISGTPGELRLFAEAWSSSGDLRMQCLSTQPAMQFYSGNFMEGNACRTGKNGVVYPNRGGFCMESQHYPDSPNRPEFPSTVLKPGEVYRENTVYSFERME